MTYIHLEKMKCKIGDILIILHEEFRIASFEYNRYGIRTYKVEKVYE